MKTKSFFICVVFLALATSPSVSPCRGAVVTFDDLSATIGGSVISNGYQGLTWTNFFSANAALDRVIDGVSGYYYGMVSISNVALNGHGNPAEIDSTGNTFNFLSAYLTGAWSSNLNIVVQGFAGSVMLYDTTVVASATSPTLFTFNYMNIDRLYFNSFGGQYAGFESGFGDNFAMDNFNFEFVPEPSAFLLTVAGALMLWPVVKRKPGG